MARSRCSNDTDDRVRIQTLLTVDYAIAVDNGSRTILHSIRVIRLYCPLSSSISATSSSSTVSRTTSSIVVTPSKMAPQARLAQGRHALLAAGVAQLVGRGAAGDHVAELVVDDDQLVDAHAAAVAGVVAAVAAPAVVELLALDVVAAAGSAP